MSEVEAGLQKEAGKRWGWLETASGDLLQQWYEQVVWSTGANVTAVKFTARDGGWLLVVNARSASRGALVSFYGGESIGDCVDKLEYDLSHNPGVRWKPDKFA